MALVETSRGWTDAGLGCNRVDAHGSIFAWINAVTWGRNTSNCEESLLTFDCNSLLRYDTIVWSSGGNYTGMTIYASTNVEQKNSGAITFSKGCFSGCPSVNCCCCNCSQWDVWLPGTGTNHWYPQIRGNASTTAANVWCNCIGETTPTGSYTLPDDLRVLPPDGLKASFPADLSGQITVSTNYWSANSNIGGTPTTYPNAKIWNWCIELLDEAGNVVARQYQNTGEYRGSTWTDLKDGWYTATALQGTTAATTSKYNLQAGSKYRIRVIANNNMNQQKTATSNEYIFDIPTPTVTITSTLYDPATKKDMVCFDWAKAASSVDEKLTMEVIVNGATIDSGTLVASTGGAAQSGTMCVTGLPTGEEVTVRVINEGGGMTKYADAKDYLPVANAAFLGFDWDDVRRTCTIRAEAPGAANCRIQAGYSANVYDVGDKLTPGEIGTLVVKDLNHGTGQVLYLQAVPEATNGHQFENEIAKVSVPIPNPILGIRTSADKKQYIVDVVEHKKGGSVTPKWQNGDRVVKNP